MGEKKGKKSNWEIGITKNRQKNENVFILLVDILIFVS